MAIAENGPLKGEQQIGPIDQYLIVYKDQDTPQLWQSMNMLPLGAEVLAVDTRKLALPRSLPHLREGITVFYQGTTNGLRIAATPGKITGSDGDSLTEVFGNASCLQLQVPPLPRVNVSRYDKRLIERVGGDWSKQYEDLTKGKTAHLATLTAAKLALMESDKLFEGRDELERKLVETLLNTQINYLARKFDQESDALRSSFSQGWQGVGLDDTPSYTLPKTAKIVGAALVGAGAIVGGYQMVREGLNYLSQDRISQVNGTYSDETQVISLNGTDLIDEPKINPSRIPLLGHTVSTELKDEYGVLGLLGGKREEKFWQEELEKLPNGEQVLKSIEEASQKIVSVANKDSFTSQDQETVEREILNILSAYPDSALINLSLMMGMVGTIKDPGRRKYVLLASLAAGTFLLSGCAVSASQAETTPAITAPTPIPTLGQVGVTTIPGSTNTAENSTSTPELSPTPIPTEVIKGYIPGAIPEGGNIIETVRTSSSAQGGALDTSSLKNKGFIVFAEPEEVIDKDGKVIGENFNVAKKQKIGDKAYWYIATPDEMFYEIDKDGDGNPIYGVARRVTDTGETIQVYQGENGEIVYRLISVYQDTIRGTPITVSDQSTSEGVVSVKFVEKDGLVMANINPFINTPEAEGIAAVVEGDQISITNGVDRKANLVVNEKTAKGEWEVKEFFKVEDYYGLGPAEVEVVERSEEDLTQELIKEAGSYEPIHNTFTLLRNKLLKNKETGEVGYINLIELGPFMISNWETRNVKLNSTVNDVLEFGEVELTVVYKNQLGDPKSCPIIFRGFVDVNKYEENFNNQVDPRDIPSHFNTRDKVNIFFIYLGSHGYLDYDKLEDFYRIVIKNKSLAEETAEMMGTLRDRKSVETILDAVNSGQGFSGRNETGVIPNALNTPIEY